MPNEKPWLRPKKKNIRKERSRRRVLLVCEDTKSSTHYFKAFPVDPNRIDLQVRGAGMNTVSLIQEALRYRKEQSEKGEVYSRVYCVLDRDSFPTANFVQAFNLCGQHDLKFTWANEAFELWYLLHFDYIDAAVSRGSYASKLAQRGLKYSKSDTLIYEKLVERQPIAIKNAERLERFWNSLGKVDSHRENPSTNIHELVNFLNELAELKEVK